MHGLVEDEQCRDRCLVFRRTIQNINLKHSKAWRFIDQNPDGSTDTEAQGLLHDLKDDRVSKYLPGENIFDFTTDWSDNEGINEQENQEYLKEFCKTFEEAVLGLIERGVKKQHLQKPVYLEILEHSHQCVEKVHRFHGRAEELKKVQEYITSSSDQPLVIHGDSGCGKTSLMAKVATEVNIRKCGILKYTKTCILQLVAKNNSEKSIGALIKQHSMGNLSAAVPLLIELLFKCKNS